MIVTWGLNDGYGRGRTHETQIDNDEFEGLDEKQTEILIRERIMEDVESWGIYITDRDWDE